MGSFSQSFFAGLELQDMVQKNRQDFEMHLMKVAEDKKRLLEQSESRCADADGSQGEAEE